MSTQPSGDEALGTGCWEGHRPIGALNLYEDHVPKKEKRWTAEEMRGRRIIDLFRPHFVPYSLGFVCLLHPLQPSWSWPSLLLKFGSAIRFNRLEPQAAAVLPIGPSRHAPLNRDLLDIYSSAFPTSVSRFAHPLSSKAGSTIARGP
ncbi:hypothetical protein NMY22_g3290 [Coprinellus aureogranulatus]|nr:hypothetical protein NMY22_g3290 [Coprinellus aureogranulatus]